MKFKEVDETNVLKLIDFLIILKASCNDPKIDSINMTYLAKNMKIANFNEIVSTLLREGYVKRNGKNTKPFVTYDDKDITKELAIYIIQKTKEHIRKRSAERYSKISFPNLRESEVKPNVQILEERKYNPTVNNMQILYADKQILLNTGIVIGGYRIEGERLEITKL